MDIAPIEKRLAAATPGPWEWHGYMSGGQTLAHMVKDYHELNVLKTTDDWPPTYADAEFIAHAPEDIRALLDEVKRLGGVSGKTLKVSKNISGHLRKLANDVAYTDGHASVMRSAADEIDRLQAQIDAVKAYKNWDKYSRREVVK